jgi:hypothetical protein
MTKTKANAVRLSAVGPSIRKSRGERAKVVNRSAPGKTLIMTCDPQQARNALNSWPLTTSVPCGPDATIPNDVISPPLCSLDSTDHDTHVILDW